MATRSRKAVGGRRQADGRRPSITFHDVCTVKLFVGANLPSRLKRSLYPRTRGLPVAIDREAFIRFLRQRIPISFPNATSFSARGTWKGGGEDSMVVEVYEPPTLRGCRQTVKKAARLAETLARRLGQDAVMVIAVDAQGRAAQSLVSAGNRRVGSTASLRDR